MGGVRNYYYFKVHTRQDNGDDDTENVIITRYFTSGYEVASFIGCSRPTVFKLIRDPDGSYFSKNYVVERCEPPVAKYEKVMVSNVEKW